MSTLTQPAPNAELSPTERRARKVALQSELSQLDEIRDGVRNSLRALLTLQHVLDADPVGHRALYDRNIEACAKYSEATARLTTRINALDNELTGLCRHDDVAAMCRMVDGEGLVTPGILAEIAGGGL